MPKNDNESTVISAVKLYCADSVPTSIDVYPDSIPNIWACRVTIDGDIFDFIVDTSKLPSLYDSVEDVEFTCWPPKKAY